MGKKQKTKNKHKKLRFGHSSYKKQRKGKALAMMLANVQGWAYELIPCTDERILAIDQELREL